MKGYRACEGKGREQRQVPMQLLLLQAQQGTCDGPAWRS